MRIKKKVAVLATENDLSMDLTLRNLEKNVLDDRPKTKTILYIEDPVEREIHRRAGDILAKQREIAAKLHDILKANPKAEVNIHALDLTSDEKAIVDKSNALYRYRIMELFDNGIAQYVHLNDPVNKWIFYSRLNWFIREMRDWLFLRWREDQIYGAPDFFDLCAGEQDRHLSSVYSKWRKYLTEEFRHWKVTMQYHKTKDILHVMKLLGHRNIKNTLIYTQLLPFTEDNKFLTKVAVNTKEACQLIEDGWKYETGEFSDGGKIFSKPK